MQKLVSALLALMFGAGVVGLSALLGVDVAIWRLEQTAPAFILGITLWAVMSAVLDNMW